MATWPPCTSSSENPQLWDPQKWRRQQNGSPQECKLATMSAGHLWFGTTTVFDIHWVLRLTNHYYFFKPSPSNHVPRPHPPMRKRSGDYWATWLYWVTSNCDGCRAVCLLCSAHRLRRWIYTVYVCYRRSHTLMLYPNFIGLFKNQYCWLSKTKKSPDPFLCRGWGLGTRLPKNWERPRYKTRCGLGQPHSIF